MRRTGVLFAGGWLLLGLGCTATGGGPQNVVMDYLTAAQVGNASAAQSHLCSHLRYSPTQKETDTLKRLVNSGVFGTGAVQHQPDGTELVALNVVEGTVPNTIREACDAVVVRQGGDWKVCGFHRA